MSTHGPHDDTRSYAQLIRDAMVGHYRIIEKIGAGGMGEVYLAQDTMLDRKVALKFLPSYLCQDPGCRARFAREALAAAKLDHPNIISVFEVGEFQGRPFFAMQHVAGQSLKQVISTKPLPLDRILQIGLQLCEGLQVAHDQGIIHRDIKPSNIMLDDHGRARILDFGLASVMGSERVTKTGSTLGTVGYMSPEQVRGEQVDHHTDIFSLGIILYEVITGHQPFKGDSDISTSRNIVEADPEPLARYKSGVPDELQRIVSKALAKDKSLRYQHADDLAADLRSLVSASTPSAGSPAKKLRTLTLVLSLLTVLALALILKPWQLFTAPPIDAPQRIVIVPFRNQTGDPALDPLGKMIADWTTQSLLGTGLAEVVPPEALLGLDPEKGIHSVGEATGAGIIVTGSYYRIGDSLQFQGKLSSADEKLLQAIEPVYAHWAAVMEGVESVRHRLLGALALLLEKKMEALSVTDISPPTYEAYREYLQGCDKFFRLFDYAGAAELYAKAVALDTSFLLAALFAAAAYANSGQIAASDSLLAFVSERRSRLTTVLEHYLDWMITSRKEDIYETLNIARRGAAIAPGSLFEYLVGVTAFDLNRPRESIDAFRRWNFDAGFARDWWPNWVYFQQAHHLIGEHKTEFEIARRGRERFPTSFELLNAQIEAAAAMGGIDDVNRLIGEVLALPAQPGSTPAGSMRIAGDELRAHGYEKEAMSLFGRALTWYESRPADEQQNLIVAYAWTLYAARRWADAERVFGALAAQFPENRSWPLALGLTAARQGDRKAALQVLQQLGDPTMPNPFGSASYNRACLAAVLGEKEQAVTLLRDSFQQGHPFTIGIHRDIDFESLRDYPPFQELLRPKG